MIKLKNPLILSFEYSDNKNILNSILDYVNSNEIGTVSITGLPSLNFIKKINTSFLSIDINFCDLNSKTIKLIQNYNQCVQQIRIIIEEPVGNSKLNTFLEKIKNNYLGSKILFYVIPWDFIDKQLLESIIKNSDKFNFTSSLLPLGLNSDSPKYNLFMELLSKFKKDIDNQRILIDSPKIMKKITKKDYICPAKNLMCHIDTNGSFYYCKFDDCCIGNIKNKKIHVLWENKNQFTTKNLKNNKNANECLANKSIKAPYSVLAKLYDKVMKEKEGLQDEYLEFVKSNFPNKETKILDVACGTGNLIKKLSYFYKNIEGVELSKEMANLSRKKTSKKIYQVDMTNFNLKKKYDLILCTFDSLNYFLNEESLKKSFKNFYRHLKENGFLIFDLNTLRKFKKHKNKVTDQKIDGSKIKWISSYNPPFWKIEIIFLNNHIFKEIHYERFYPLTVIKEILKDCGFKNIKHFNGSLMNSDTNNKRVFFIVSKSLKKNLKK